MLKRGRDHGNDTDPFACRRIARAFAFGDSARAHRAQGRESGQVAVDYTQVRHVRKPPAARPGMVIYDTYQTAYVVADEAVVKKLSEDGNKSTSAS